MNKQKALRFAQGALIAAMYVALKYAQDLIFPGTTSAAIQFRLSEALMLLCVFTPSAIPGLTIGCAVANMTSVSFLPADMLIGSFATFLSALCIWKTRDVTFKKMPVIAALMPAIFNGVLIGLEIEAFFIEGPFRFSGFLIQACCVAAGELGVCLSAGLLMVSVIKKRGLDKRLFK